MRVLVLSPSLPWPLDAGGRIRTFHLLRELRRSHEIALWCVRQPGAGAGSERALGGICDELRVFERSARGRLERLAAPRPETWFYSRSLREAVGGLAGEFDLIHVDELCLARCLPERVPCPVLVHHHKLDLELAQALERSAARGALEVRRWRRLELDAVARSREHVFCCDDDAQRFVARHPRVRAHVVQSGVDLGRFKPAGRARDEDHLLVLGSLDYEPNARGLEGFLRCAWPSLRASRPGLRLSLVGRGADPHRWRDLPPGVRLAGAVEDVRPWLAQATALVVPLSIGGGTRLKIVEAAAMGCPVISTRVGAEGLALMDSQHLWMADEIASLPACTARALESPAERRRRSQAARRRVLERYGWPTLAGRLEQAWAGRNLSDSSHAGHLNLSGSAHGCCAVREPEGT